jgi:DNA repair protein RecO (recombination protein O)
VDRQFKGIVIKEKPTGEKGKLLYVLTESQGVVQVTATGARSISASYLKSVQLFAYSDLSVYEKNGRMTLTEASLIESFYGIRSDLSAFAAASYMAELCFLVSVAENDGVLPLFLNALYALANSLAETKLVKAVFEYRLCLILGLAPDFSGCAACGGKGNAFSFAESELFCRDCLPEGEEAFELGDAAVSALDYLNRCARNKILSFSLTGEDKDTFCAFCEKYLLYAADIAPKTLDFYKEIENGILPQSKNDT